MDVCQGSIDRWRGEVRKQEEEEKGMERKNNINNIASLPSVGGGVQVRRKEHKCLTPA